MKKFKYLAIIILVTMGSTSCVEDEFGSVVGTWIKSSGSGALFKPPLVKEEPPCKKDLIITFKKNRIGQLDKDDYCGSDYELAGFKYNIKEGELTITFDNQSTANNWDIISGVNTYVVSGSILTIKSRDGTIVVLTRE